MAHEDFCGHTGRLNPGDLQWMTAGRGILHAEMPCSEEPAHGLQLWVNLRSSEKMVEPQYQELKNEEIPKPSQNGVTVAVISGEALNIKVKTFHDKLIKYGVLKHQIFLEVVLWYNRM
uniref:Uncharacterized protein n=1 Tax=Sphaerodactylus townsendi TaxID=933632 RepID=A0ACB8FHW2_9SAUR